MKTKIVVRKAYAAVFIVALLSVSLAMAARGQTNLVWNGSFEDGPAGESVFTDWNWTGPADSYSDYGVALAGGGNEVAEQGNYFAYFRGHPNDNSQDCLGNSVGVTMGALYNISYYLGTDGPLTNGAAMWVVIGTSFGISPVDQTLTEFFPNSATALPYQKFSTFYMDTNPPGSTVILSFHGINASNNLPVTNGILLDNVSMMLVYPPMNVKFTHPSSLTFTWPYTNSPYRLQSSTNLSTTNWTTLTNVPVNAGTNSQVAMAVATNRVVFYRLTLP